MVKGQEIDNKNSFHPWMLATNLADLECGLPPPGSDGEEPTAMDLEFMRSGIRRSALSLFELLEPNFSKHDGEAPSLDYHAALNNFILGYGGVNSQWSHVGTEEGRSLYLHLYNHDVLIKKREDGEWPPPKSQDVLKTFVRDLIQNQIFTHTMGRPSDITLIFLPLSMGGLSDRSYKELSNIGVIYEYFREASPRAVNGCPIFFSACFMNKADWGRCCAAADAQVQLLKEIKV